MRKTQITAAFLFVILPTVALIAVNFSSGQQSADSKAANSRVLQAAKAAKSEPMTDAQFKTVHDYIVGEDPKWDTIQWHSDLWNAQIEAAKKKKPIFIWAMNGDPLGCV
ncbi:MAG: hypothetical protein AB8B55_03880 [Mariniblastus sp.]